MESWRRFLADLMDPACRLRVTLAGRLQAPSWDLGERRLEEHMLHVIQAGGQDGTIAGGAVRTRAGDLLWVPPGVVQHLRLAPGCRLLHKTFLRFDLERDGRPVPWPTGEPWVRPLGAEVQGWLSEAVREHHFRQDGDDARVRSYLTLVFTAWMRAGRRRPGTLDASRRAHLLDLIAGDPGWTTTSLAQRLGMSPLHLTRQVRATWGVSLRRFLVESRLRAAARDLRAGSEAVGVIASRHGWHDPFLFTRLFTRLHGISPRVYRRG